MRVVWLAPWLTTTFSIRNFIKIKTKFPETGQLHYEIVVPPTKRAAIGLVVNADFIIDCVRLIKSIAFSISSSCRTNWNKTIK